MEIPSFMAVLPTWQFATMFVGVCVALVMVSTVLVRRATWFGRAAESAEFIGLIYPMIGAIYGVMLAFTIVLSWQRFAEAEIHSSSEVTLLSSLWRNSQAFDCPAQEDIEKRLLAYATSVIECEWKSLASVGENHTRTSEAYEKIWRFYRAYVPRSDTEIRFYEAALTQLNELGIHRRQRIMSATSEISSIVWVFLGVGGIVTVLIPMIFWTKFGVVQVAVNGVMAFFVAFSLWIVGSLQYPYSGEVNISAAPFEVVIDSFKKRQGTDLKCPIETPPLPVVASRSSRNSSPDRWAGITGAIIMGGSLLARCKTGSASNGTGALAIQCIEVGHAKEFPS